MKLQHLILMAILAGVFTVGGCASDSSGDSMKDMASDKMEGMKDDAGDKAKEEASDAVGEAKGKAMDMGGKVMGK